MVNFPILYTGKGTTQPLKEMGDSFEQFSQKYIETQKIKLNKALKDEQWLLDQQIDPVQLMADQAMTKQASSIEWYNEKYAERMARNDGQLTTQDKLEMASDKRRIMSEQQQMASAQQRAVKEYDIITKDFRGDFNRKAFQEAWEQFLTTGKYPTSGLVPNPKDIVTHLMSIPSSRKEEVTTEAGGKLQTTYGSREEMQMVLSNLLANDGTGGYIEGLKRDFDKNTTLEEKAKWLDVNNDGTTTQAERQNGILRWAMESDYYLDAYQRGKTKPKTKSGSGTAGASKFGSQSYVVPSSKTPVVEYGKEITNEEGVKTKEKVAKEDVWEFTQPIRGSGVIPTDAATVLTGESTSNLRENIPVDFEIVGYSEESDEWIIVLGKKNVMQGVFMGSTTTVSLPVDAISADFQRIEVGEQGQTIRELRNKNEAKKPKEKKKLY